MVWAQTPGLNGVLLGARKIVFEADTWIQKERGGGRIVWLNHINYIGPLVQLGNVGVSMSVLHLWWGRNWEEQQFSWSNYFYNWFKHDKGVFGPPTTGGLFTCLVNWAITNIYKTYENDLISVHGGNFCFRFQAWQLNTDPGSSWLWQAFRCHSSACLVTIQ